MILDLDTSIDVAYVKIADRPVARSRELGPLRIADYDAQNKLVGIEFLSVHQGVDLIDLPYRTELEQLFRKHNIAYE